LAICQAVPVSMAVGVKNHAGFIPNAVRLRPVRGRWYQAERARSTG
jgi:hypothetical protein